MVTLFTPYCTSRFVASTGQVSTDVIKRYIDNQKSK